MRSSFSRAVAAWLVALLCLACGGDEVRDLGTEPLESGPCGERPMLNCVLDCETQQWSPEVCEIETGTWKCQPGHFSGVYCDDQVGGTGGGR